MANIGHNQPPAVNANSLSPADKKKVKHVIQVLNDSMTRVAAEKQLQTDEINALHQTLGVDKRVLRRLAKAVFKTNFNEEVEANESFQDFYNLVVKDSSGDKDQ
jgi:lysyl-tRNA synthetase class I